MLLDKRADCPEVIQWDSAEAEIIWTYCVEFFRRFGDAPGYTSMYEHFVTIKEVTVLDRLEQLAAGPSIRSVGDALVRFENYLTSRTQKMVQEAFLTGSHILTRGMEVKKGRNTIRVQGPSAAVEHINSVARTALAPLDRRRFDLGSLAQDVLDQHDAEGTIGALTGFDAIDKATGGIQPGALWLVAGFAKHGKSTFSLNVAYNAATFHGIDVVYSSLEMPVQQVSRYLLAIHQLHRKFVDVRPQYGIGTFIPADDILHHRVEGRAREFLGIVAEDLRNRPGGEGRIMVLPPTGKATVSSVFAQADAVKQECENLGLLVVDYAQMLQSGHWTDNDTQNQREIVRDLKLGAMDFDRGKGIPVLTPWQINRDGFQEAVKRRAKTPAKVYDPTALSRSSEAERSADLVLATWIDDDLRYRERIHIECVLSREVEFPSHEYPIWWNAHRIACWQPEPDVSPKGTGASPKGGAIVMSTPTDRGAADLLDG